MLREYQNEAITAIIDALCRDPNALLQAATGAGKTEIFSEIIHQFTNGYAEMRIVIVVHRTELVTQARDRLLNRSPELAPVVGTACASIGKVVLDKPVTYASVQTLCKREIDAVDLLIIDEAHHVPAVEDGGMYHELITCLRSKNANLRVLGVTATPYRLNHGYIYGKRCMRGKSNLWPELSHEIGMEWLQAHGWLCQARFLAPSTADLTDVRIAAGEFVLDDLGNVLCRQKYLDQARDAITDHAQDRKRIIVFCSTIAHAEAVAAILPGSVILHSGLSTHDRNNALMAFRLGLVRTLVNVQIATEGVDVPESDCIVMVRPTMSPALYVQMIGRGLRPAEGKHDCLVLDLVGNTERHGNPARPRVEVPEPPNERRTDAVLSVENLRRCPSCKREVTRNALSCLFCGYSFVSTQPLDLEEVSFESERGDRLEGAVSGITLNHYQRLGNESLEVVCTVGKRAIKSFFSVDGTRFKTWWNTHGRTPCPASIDEAVHRAGEIQASRISAVKEGRYWKVVRWER